MSNFAIVAENISKQYRLGKIGTGTLSHDLNRWWNSIRGKEDPFLKIGDINDRSTKGQSDYVWSLKEINFQVNTGDAVGIIGRNGAGKSTLLKLLSKVTKPTTGSFKVNGRIASLLEVGTGFHPEMTGRENIYMNGAILGMTKKEITRKFDEIVDFSGVERYTDTPVKRYSSGMYVRLAFAVAAHLESEILIVDEVLAVGDAEFQKKCLGKMGDISKGEGRTVLFVSHNMAAVKTLCNKGIVLQNGRKVFDGDTIDAVSYYLKGDTEVQNKKTFGKDYDKEDFTLHEISINPVGKSTDDVLDEYSEIELNTIIDIKQRNDELHLTYVLNDEYGESLFAFTHLNANIALKKGINRIKCTFPKGFLNIGSYYLTINMIENCKRSIFVEKDIFHFTIQEGERNIGAWMGREPGFIKPIFNWSIS